MSKRILFAVVGLFLVVNCMAEQVIVTKKNDHLWQLAKQVRPDSTVTIQQTMYALYQKNPKAFLGNNTNALIEKSVLRVPSLDEIRAVIPHEAIKWMSQSNEIDPQSRNYEVITLDLDGDLSVPDLSFVSHEALKESINTKGQEGLWDADGNKSTQGSEQSGEPSEMPANAVDSEDKHNEVPSERQQQIVYVNKLDDVALNRIDTMERREQEQAKMIDDLQAEVKIMQANVISQNEYAHQFIDQYKQNALQHPIASWILHTQFSDALSIKSMLLNDRYIVVIMALFLLLFIVVAQIKNRDNRASVKADVTAGSYDMVDEEYDFMNSDEGVTARLDLARAYLNMNDFSQARETLNEIMKYGNSQQKQQAQDLLNNISSNKT